MEWDRDTARDAGRDFYTGSHLGTRVSRPGSPLPRHEAPPVPMGGDDADDGTEDLRACPQCGMPDLRQVTNVGPRGYVYVRDACIECGYTSEPWPDV